MADTKNARTPESLLKRAWGKPPEANADNEEKGAYVWARFTVQNDHYVGFYQTWMKTILFLLNKQWIKWMAKVRRYVVDTDVPAWQQQPVTNVVYAIYRSIEAKLKKQRPALEVVPPSGDSDDRESADLGQSLLQHLWRLLKMPHKMRRGIGWFLSAGAVFISVHWDPDAGELVPFTELREFPHSNAMMAALGETEDRAVPLDEDGEPFEDEDGNLDLEHEPALVPEGQIAVEIVDPLCVRTNPECRDYDEADEFYIADLWTREDAIEHFKLEEEDLPDGQAGDGDRQMYEDLLSSAAAGPGWLGGADAMGSQIGASQESAIGNRVLVIAFYSRKERKKYPNGRHWINVGTRKVWPPEDDEDYPDGEAPLPNGFWPPVVPVLATPIPNQPQAIGVLSQVVPLNEAINTLDAKILEHHVQMTMGGKWIVHPEDKGLKITSDPGQKLTSKGYALGKQPIQAQIEALPAEVYNERTVLMDKVRLVSSVSQQELGGKPEGVNAGRAFLVLQEAVDTVIGPDLEAWESAFEEVGRRMLVLGQRYYRESRKIQIRGERGQWEVRSFDGADLVDGLDVRVQVGSSFPWSKSAQWDTKLSILAQFPGLVQRPDGSIDQERFSHFMDVGASGLSSFQTDEDDNIVEVQREHAMFEAYDPSKGEMQIPQVAFWQAHAIHLEEHFRFMKRDYARFERWNPAAQDAFLQHMQQTMHAVDQLAGMAAQAASAGAQPGGEAAPGGAPGGAPPEAGAGEEGAGGEGAPPQLTVMPGGAGPGARSMTQPALAPADFRAASQG